MHSGDKRDRPPTQPISPTDVTPSAAKKLKASNSPNVSTTASASALSISDAKNASNAQSKSRRSPFISDPNGPAVASNQMQAAGDAERRGDHVNARSTATRASVANKAIKKLATSTANASASASGSNSPPIAKLKKSLRRTREKPPPITQVDRDKFNALWALFEGDKRQARQWEDALFAAVHHLTHRHQNAKNEPQNHGEVMCSVYPHAWLYGKTHLNPNARDEAKFNDDFDGNPFRLQPLVSAVAWPKARANESATTRLNMSTELFTACDIIPEQHEVNKRKPTSQNQSKQLPAYVIPIRDWPLLIHKLAMRTLHTTNLFFDTARINVYVEETDSIDKHRDEDSIERDGLPARPVVGWSFGAPQHLRVYKCEKHDEEKLKATKKQEEKERCDALHAHNLALLARGTTVENGKAIKRTRPTSNDKIELAEDQRVDSEEWLYSGSMYWMKSDCQMHYMHAVPRMKPGERRIAITFRQHNPDLCRYVEQHAERAQSSWKHHDWQRSRHRLSELVAQGHQQGAWIPNNIDARSDAQRKRDKNIVMTSLYSTQTILPLLLGIPVHYYAEIILSFLP